MDKAPLLCRIKSNIIRKSPSAIMAGCNFGIFPSGKCIDCPEYNAWWEEFEWSILKMVELKPEQIKAAEAVLAKGRCVEIRPTKDGVKVLEVIRHQAEIK